MSHAVTVAVKGKDVDVIGHLPLGKSGKFAKTISYFLKSDKNHHCKTTVTGKATNAGDGLGMKVHVNYSFSRRRKVYNYPPRKTHQTFVKFLKFI